jgi:nondiscriminating glutamyl-tRNA synthetase
MTVRVRFAPSPTGPLHLGNARIAIINKLFAEKSGGAFVLRIEDTDPARLDPASESLIVKELSWLGIVPDEGPGFGGALGPYRQGERHEIYREIADRLLTSGVAYPCFCTDEMLEAERKAAATKLRPPRYSGRCRDLSKEEVAARAGEPFAIRFRADFDEIRVTDLIHGEVAFSPDAFGDFIIVRADGSAVFLFSSAVDDSLMGITHVIRGEDHLPNTPRQILIFRALGKEPPSFAHVPLILSESGEKIKKREGGWDLESLIERGYTPEGVFSYLAALGNPGLSDKGIVGVKEAARSFDISRLGRGAVRVEEKKLLRANVLAIRGLAADELARRLGPILAARGYDIDAIGAAALERFADAVGENIETLGDALVFAPIFFDRDVPLDDGSRELLSRDDSRRILETLLRNLDGVGELTAVAFRAAVTKTGDETGTGGKALFGPIRAALTGMAHGPALEEIAGAIGLARVRGRISRAREPLPPT